MAAKWVGRHKPKPHFIRDDEEGHTSSSLSVGEIIDFGVERGFDSFQIRRAKLADRWLSAQQVVGDQVTQAVEDNRASPGSGPDSLTEVSGPLDRLPVRRSVVAVALDPIGHFWVAGTASRQEDDRAGCSRCQFGRVAALPAARAAENQDQLIRHGARWYQIRAMVATHGGRESS